MSNFIVYKIIFECSILGLMGVCCWHSHRRKKKLCIRFTNKSLKRMALLKWLLNGNKLTHDLWCNWTQTKLMLYAQNHWLNSYTHYICMMLRKFYFCQSMFTIFFHYLLRIRSCLRKKFWKIKKKNYFPKKSQCLVVRLIKRNILVRIFCFWLKNHFFIVVILFLIYTCSRFKCLILFFFSALS